jgi:hypothetical protein
VSEASALKAAIELFHVPAHVRDMRRDPLPAGIPLLLRLAAGEPEAAREAVERSGREPENCRSAAVFFIEQILLYPGADSYRTLGLDRNATATDLRRNRALLLKWLHPDLGFDSQRSALTRRVIEAWDQVKTPERRRLYDEAHTLGSQPRRGSDRARIGARIASRVLRKTPRKAPVPTTDPRTKHAARKSRRLRGLLGFFFRFSRGGPRYR